MEEAEVEEGSNGDAAERKLGWDGASFWWMRRVGGGRFSGCVWAAGGFGVGGGCAGVEGPEKKAPG